MSRRTPPSRPRLRTVLGAATAAALALTLVACGGSDEPSATPSSPAISASATPSETESTNPSDGESIDNDPHVGEDSTETGPKSIAIGDPKPASSFSGDDTAFAKQYAALLKELSLPAPVDDATAVGIGKDFCAVLSSGGLIGRKVDFWAGQHDYVGNDWSTIFQAALDEYCHNYLDAYLTERTVERTPPVAEEVDVVRYVGDVGLGDGAFDARSDDDISTEATSTCTSLKANPDALTGLLQTASTDDKALLTGYVLGFCPEVAQS